MYPNRFLTELKDRQQMMDEVVGLVDRLVQTGSYDAADDAMKKILLDAKSWLAAWKHRSERDANMRFVL